MGFDVIFEELGGHLWGLGAFFWRWGWRFAVYRGQFCGFVWFRRFADFRFALGFGTGFGRLLFRSLDHGWHRGRLLRGGEIFAILADIRECVAKVAIERGEVSPDEVEALDVEFGRRDGGIDGLIGVGGEFAREGFAGERLPGEGEMESGIILFHREIFV